jgi:para-nitrobenzyl esterase
MQSVRTQSGVVEGVAADGGRCAVFKGIPFAAPPVGALRWRAPQPPESWAGKLRADHYANAPLQPLHAADHLLAQLGFAEVPECGISENCLFLNVWTPAHSSTDLLPVIVWLYGGGNRVGSGSHPVSEGTGLARAGCVVVTLNHRLSGLGFLAHPALSAESGGSGNYALHDVIAALQWVQANIRAFGGNPQCVTLFGQSAGGALVNVLMGAAAARGLVHRCIVHSAGRMHGGPMGGLRPRGAAEADGARLMESLHARDLAAMRALPGDALYGAPRQFGPIIDGQLITEAPQHSFNRGAQLAVPLLAGFTLDEAASFPNPEWQTRAGFEQFIGTNLGSVAGGLLRHYAVADDASARRASFELRRDVSFAYQPWQLAHTHATHSAAPVWLFEFRRAVPLPPHVHFHGEPAQGWGAFHGAELWYVFNTLDRRPDFGWSEADRALATQMCAYWANFARSGDPNGGGLAAWPRFDATAAPAMLLGGAAADTARCRGGTVSNALALGLIRRHYLDSEGKP